ncbi:hypothetical protein BDW59DRAFT_82495 [Aspergillus cavernicola]|uniref:DUF7357 domain-containing protein n=1 Tax=Aspergillus cavernicola TaxID=176166 RepID=A0ABR4IAL0_9EURO
MRLHLTIQRHGLPVTRILWTTSPPSLFGHNLTSPSSMIPATSSAVTSSRAPNALFANGGYTVAQLLEDVNEVIPLETEPRLFEDQSSGQWGLEDYVVEVAGSECLHYMEVEGLLRDGDEVLIRALQISDLRVRRLSGRHQIASDGKHLIDGVPFGKPFLKRPTSSRPAIMIPPRKKRRTALALWGSGSTYEEEDTEWAPPRHVSTGKELSLLKPDSELEKSDEGEYQDSYQDDYEDYHEPNEDGDGTVIRHNIDNVTKARGSDDDASDLEATDLSQELQDLKKDMDTSVVPELEKPDEGVSLRGYSMRSRPSIQQAMPRKSSFSRRSIRGASDGNSSRRDSKSVTFDSQRQELPGAKLEASLIRAGSTSEDSEASVSSESDTSSSVSDSSESGSSDGDSFSDKSAAASEAASESSSESDDSSSESSASESESEQEDVPEPSNVLKPSHRANPPGAGSRRTKKSNQRSKMRRRLSKLKEMGVLKDDADFDSLRKWEIETGGSFYLPETTTDPKKCEREEFEAKRQKLLRDLESGGVDVSLISEKENISPNSVKPDTSQLFEDNDEQYETANDTNETSPSVPQRRTLDVSSTRRLLFGSLGVRTPRSKEEEEATRKKLAGKAQKVVSQQKEQEAAEAAETHESESDIDWREKLILGATECVYDDIELSTPPFPFEQHWDAEAGNIIRQRKGWGRKRKRRQQHQVYDEEGEGNENEYYAEDDTLLNYDDAELPEAEADNHDESEQISSKSVTGTEEELPSLPSDIDGLPVLTGEDMNPGLVFAFKQLDLSKATNWQPTVSEYRVAVVSDAFDDGFLGIRLAEPYRRQPKDVDIEEGPFQYSGFEMPGMDDDEGEDDGYRQVPFDDLIDPKLLRAAPGANAGDKNAASIFPADEESPAREPSQSGTGIPATSDAHEDDQPAESYERPTTPKNTTHLPSTQSSRNDSPIQSPRFDGFELSHSASSPLLSVPPFSAASSSGPRDEDQEGPSSAKGDDADSQLPSTCPPNVDDHDLQETGLTDQLQTISSPGSVGSYHHLMNFLLSQNLSSPLKSERKSSPVELASESGSAMVPNPFYEIDKAYEERRKNSRVKAERDSSYDSVSSRGSSPKMVPSSPVSARKSPTPTQDPSPVSVIPGSILPEALNQSPPASQMPESFIDLTQSSPPMSPGESDEDFAKSHRLLRAPGWVPKNLPATRRQTRQSSSSSRVIGTLRNVSISPPRRRRRRKP